MQKEAECVTKIAKIIVGGTFIRLERQGTKRRDRGQCARCRIFGGVNASQGSVGRRRAAAGHVDEQEQGLIWTVGGRGGGLGGRFWEIGRRRRTGPLGSAPKVGCGETGG